MSEETIVAVYDTVAHAELAISDLEESGIPSSSISRHAETDAATTTTTGVVTPTREHGFWSKLFGGEPESDAPVYDRAMQNGATVVTVQVEERHADAVLDILESHQPIDLDERAASYGVTGTAAQTTAYDAADAALAPTAADETLSLSEERLAVGKRLVNRGGTRIRRFVTETPVEEQISLHEERVTLERVPVTDGRPVTGADFSEKTIEMTESAEEAVVSKSAFVTEEIRLRKAETDRVETIRDTLRKEDVEVEQIAGTPSRAL